MVPLAERIGYNCKVEDKPTITCFNAFIKGDAISHVIPDGTNDMDKLYFGALQSITSNSQNDFNTAYNDFSRRTPSEDSVWIHNEFLIFVLICGIEKFNIDKNWINQVIQVRSTTGNQQYLKVNQTFKNILSGNTQSTDNLNEIIIVFLDILNRPQLSNEILNKTYLGISNNTELMDTRDDFFLTMSFRAFDVIILTKDTPDATEFSNLRSFKTRFSKRVNIVSQIIYYLILLGLISTIYKFVNYSANFREFVSDLGLAFGLIGLAFLGAIKWIQSQLEKLLLKIFGYKF